MLPDNQLDALKKKSGVDAWKMRLSPHYIKYGNSSATAFAQSAAGGAENEKADGHQAPVIVLPDAVRCNDVLREIILLSLGISI